MVTKAMTILSVCNIASILAVIAFGFIPISGNNIINISDKYVTLASPVNYSFSVWGILFGTLFFFSIWQLLPANRSSEEVRAIGLWLIVASLSQIFWVISWNSEDLQLASVLMLSLWCALYGLNLALAKACGNKERRRTYEDTSTFSLLFQQTPSLRTIILRLPFGLWLGLATFAMLLNLTIVFYWKCNISFFNTELWAALLLIISGGFGLLWGIITVDFVPNQDISLPLAIGWSCFGAFLHGAGTNINAVALSTAGAMLGFVIVHMIVRAAVYCRGKRRSVLSYHEQQQLDQESLLQKLSDQLVTENAINSTQRDYVSVLYHS